MEASKLAEQIIKHITVEEYEKQQIRASYTKKFYFSVAASYEASCAVCEKRISYYGFAFYHKVCSSCARKIARIVVQSTSMKRIRAKTYSKGVGYGYKLATSEFGKETIVFLDRIVSDAKTEGKTVHFLGRDMDMLYMYYQFEDNTNYLAGWNSHFCTNANRDDEKRILIARNNVQHGDYVVDTGFAGSILTDIRKYVEVKGYILSGNSICSYPCLYRNDTDRGYEYRCWIENVENLYRARTVDVDERNIPYEEYCRPSWYEQGVFNGFVLRANRVMRR